MAQRLPTRMFWRGEGELLDSAHGGLFTHFSVPRRVVSELDAASLRFERVLGNAYPRSNASTHDGLVLLRIHETHREVTEALRLVVLTEIPEDAELRQQWNALVDRVDRPQVFYTYEWSLAVQRAYSSTLHPLRYCGLRRCEFPVRCSGPGNRPRLITALPFSALLREIIATF